MVLNHLKELIYIKKSKRRTGSLLKVSEIFGPKILLKVVHVNEVTPYLGTLRSVTVKTFTLRLRC